MGGQLSSFKRDSLPKSIPPRREKAIRWTKADREKRRALSLLLFLLPDPYRIPPSLSHSLYWKLIADVALGMDWKNGMNVLYCLPSLPPSLLHSILHTLLSELDYIE